MINFNMFMKIYMNTLKFQIVLSSILPLMLNNLLIIWLMMEISTMSFFLYLNLNSKKSLIYFMIQVFSSSIILMYMITMNIFFFEYLLMMSFFLKIGIYPLSWWVPNMFKIMGFNEIFYLNTLLKIPPMILFMNLMIMNNMFMIISFMNLIFSTLMNLKQNNVKKILGYSSMFHSNLMMLIILLNMKLWIIYMLMYTVISYSMLKIFLIFNLKIYNLLMNYNLIMIYMFYIFMYSGLPMFSFFSIKWMLMNILCLKNYFFLSLIIMFLSFMMMFSYFRLMYMYMYMNKKMFKMIKINYNFNYMILLTLFFWLVFMLI